MAPTREEMEFLYPHVFLPPQLPEGHDPEQSENPLMKVTLDTLKLYKATVPGTPGIDSVITGLTAASHVHATTDSTVDEDALLKAIEQLPENCTLPLYVKAQNAAVLITSKKNEGTVFEQFELAPSSAAVITTKGRLVRAFPGSAALVKKEVATSAQFRSTFSQTIAKMSSQRVATMRPEIEKTGQKHAETRDTVNPAIVSDLLVGAVLTAMSPGGYNMESITKNTRDEVVMCEQELPWRRAPLWMLVRVFLQLKLSSAANMKGSHRSYKMFMVFLMSHVLNAALDHNFPIEALYFMSTKITKRLLKLEKGAEHGITIKTNFDRVMENTLHRCKEHISGRWTKVQRLQPTLDLSSLAYLDFQKDSLIDLPDLGDYIERRRYRTTVRSDAEVHLSSGSRIFSPHELPSMNDIKGPYKLANLFRFEQWVASHLQRVVVWHEDDDAACAHVEHMMYRYHDIASTTYGQNPEALSIMVLTIVELWMACDRRALAVCPWLADYDPGVTADTLQRLLLPRKAQMARLQKVEQYLDARFRNSRLPPRYLFGDPQDRECFAVRYFDQYPGLQKKKIEIEDRAARNRLAKKTELRSQKSIYENLILAYQQAHCQYHFVPVPGQDGDTKLEHDDEGCQKCQLKHQAAAMKIFVHEWPLPEHDAKAKAVLFELNVPVWYAAWRDSTTFVSTDILQGSWGEQKARYDWTLHKDPHLKDDLQQLSGQRVVLWSKTKPVVGTHYKSQAVSDATEDRVCVRNGLRYVYYDTNKEHFMTKLERSHELSVDLAYMLPDRSMALSKFMVRPHHSPDGPDPNTVIASQSDCPEHMTPAEYKELCSLPLGHTIQWLNILLQLAVPNIDFKKDETALIILQCIYQAGPQGGTSGVERAAHQILTLNSAFTNLLFENLDAALSKIQENWECANALLIFASIAARVLSLTNFTSMREKSMTFLRRARDVAYGWMMVLRRKTTDAFDPMERQEFREKSMEIALICAATFDADGDNLSSILNAPNAASIFVQCAVILAEREWKSIKNGGTLMSVIQLRYQRILTDTHPIFASSNVVGLDDAISTIWPDYGQDKGAWKSVWKTLDHWMATEVELVNGHAMPVHYDTLSGKFLVNGKPLIALTSTYTDDPLYKALFGKWSVEVMASTMPGMHFTGTKTWHDHAIHLSKDHYTGLLVQAIHEGTTYEVLPTSVFDHALPSHFAHDYVHWYNSADDTVQFRPKNEPWSLSSPETWILSRHPASAEWQLRKNGQCILGVLSATSRQLSSALSSLAEPSIMHLVADLQRGSLEVDIPEMQLGFLLDAGASMLRSRDHRGMQVDTDQTLDTLIGLQSKLMLRNRHNTQRMVLVPDGMVHYRKSGDHMHVTIDKKSIRKVHPVQVDTRLGRLVDNGSIQCKLQLCYLHALTSAPLRDPLTNLTGTEQALMIIDSAAFRSFELLDENDLLLLQKIIRLTPVREFYPSPDCPMLQKITWDSQLSALSQHGRFKKAVESVIEQVRRSSVFYSGAGMKSSRLAKVLEQNSSDHSLLERDAIRGSTFRSSGFGAECYSTVFDEEYAARDRCVASESTSNAAIISRMIYTRANKLCWPSPEPGSSWAKISNRGSMPRRSDPLERHMMRYDMSWVENQSNTLEYLLPLHVILTRSDGSTVNRYSLMMWLASMAFAPGPDLVTLQVIALLHSSPELHQIFVPDLQDCQPKLGLDCRTPEAISKLEECSRDARVAFDQSPAAAMEPKSGEQPSQTKWRRQARYDNWKDNAARTFVKGVRSQWPKAYPTQRPQPTMPSLQQYTGYLNIDQAMSRVHELFRALWSNNVLFKYLQQVEAALATLETSQLSLPPQPRRLPAQAAKSQYVGIPNSRLFAQDAPQVGQICPRLRVEQINDHKDELSSPTGHHLGLMVQRLKAAAIGQQHQYVDDLGNSLHALKRRGSCQYSLPTLKTLQGHLRACEDYRATLYDIINKAIDKSLGTVRKAALNRPAVSPTYLLQQLGRKRWSLLSAGWQTLIVNYGISLSALQRAERLLKTAESSQDDLRSELANPGHTNWDPMEYPESLLLEIESGITIREVQEEIAREMRSPTSGKNSVMQLNMGEGKSSVIIPIVAASLANGSQLVRTIVAKPQSKQMAQMLISKLGGMLDRRVYHLPFSRAVKLDQGTTSTVEAICRECMLNGGILLMQPEHILSFKLMGPECFISGRQETGRAVLHIQDFFDSSARDIVDESDENFSVKFELIYTLGSQQAIDMTPKRWIYIQQILDLAKHYTLQVVKDEPLGLEVTSRATGGFPRLRVLKAETGDRLISCIARHVCETGLGEFPIADQPETLRQAILVYITKYDLQRDETDIVEKSSLWTGQTKMLLLLLRGLFAAGVLAFVLEQKRWRVNYGLTTRTPRTRLAVPYRAKDSPSPRSEFSHPDVVIVFTCMSYYYGGLSDEELFLAFGHLSKSDQPEAEYSLWIKDVMMPNEFTAMEGINLKDRPTCTSLVFPPLRYAKGAIDYFLGHVVFPREMRQFPHKMSGSGWDIGKTKTLPTTGFSGTNDSRALLPLDVHHLDLPNQKHTNALVLDYLLQPGNTVAMMTMNSTNAFATDAEQLLANVLNLEPSPKVILDVGAQILELDNREVAQTWLQMCSNSRMQAAVFCDDNDELFVIDRNGCDEPLQTSSFATRLDTCLVYLDEAHTRGIDLKLPANYKAAVTLGAGLTKDRLVQACMRMRKLGKGQNVVFCISTEIETKIRACTHKHHGETLEVDDVLTWSIYETYEEIRRGIPLWVTQGHRFVIQEDLWSAASINGSTVLTADSALEFREPEAQSMQHRYGPGRDFQTSLTKLEKSEHPRFQAIVQHCRSFDYRTPGARRLQEEQERERELSPEVEEESVIERAAAAQPAVHHLHKHMRTLVTQGYLEPVFKAWRPAFGALSDTSMAKDFKDLAKLDRFPGLLVSTDFMRTVKKTTEEYVSDVYQRPVQWILSVRKAAQHPTVDQLIIISAFEAQHLLADVMLSKKVAMHLYKPRCHIGHPSLDKLDFYTISGRPLQLDVPQSLTVQLNVFAGQLYFASFDEYLGVCEFLQLSGHATKVGMKVDSDGFIRSNGLARIGAGLRLSETAVPFLREFLSKVRRHGEDIARTHFGRLLDRQLLREEDFEQDGDIVV